MEKHLNIVGLVTILILSLIVGSLALLHKVGPAFVAVPASSQVGAVGATVETPLSLAKKEKTRIDLIAGFSNLSPVLAAYVVDLQDKNCQLRNLLGEACGTSVAANLTISASTDTPPAGLVIIDSSATTDGVVLLKGKLRLQGSLSAVLDKFPVTLTTVGGANLAAVTGSVTLKLGGEEFTESVGATSCVPSCVNNTVATVTFDNLDYNIPANTAIGNTVDFEVLADINDIEPGTLDEGDKLKAEVTAANRGAMDIENSNGDQLTASQRTGTAIGNAQELRSAGVQVSLVSVNASNTAGPGANDDIGTFTIRYRVTAIGDDIYLSSGLVDTGAIANLFDVDRSGVKIANGLTSMIINDSPKTSNGNFKITEGTSWIITAQVAVSNSIVRQAGQFRAGLEAVRWNSNDSGSVYNSYTNGLETFKTNYLTLN